MTDRERETRARNIASGAAAVGEGSSAQQHNYYSSPELTALNVLIKRTETVEEQIKDQKTVSSVQWQGAFRALGLLSEEQFEHGSMLREHKKALAAFDDKITALDTTIDTKLDACRGWLIWLAVVVALNAGVSLVLLVAFVRGWL